MLDPVCTLSLARSGGFTLIEAVAAVAICATAVVALLGVRHRLTQDMVRAERLAEANVVAGDLAARWRLGQVRIDPHEQQSGQDERFGLRYELVCDPKEMDDGTFLNRLRVRVFGRQQDELVSLEVWRRMGA
jgi:type II secretory pathway pseudopilin PulG